MKRAAWLLLWAFFAGANSYYLFCDVAASAWGFPTLVSLIGLIGACVALLSKRLSRAVGLD